MKRWTIYCHTHVATGRRYIGLTVKTMLHRWNQHCAQARSSKGGRWHFPNAIRQYGKDAFTHVVLMQLDDLDLANAWEEFWIEFLGTCNPEYGFNLSRGGGHTPHPAKNPWDRPEYREKALAATRKKCSDPTFRAKIAAARRGVPLSDAHKEAMSAANRGKDYAAGVRATTTAKIRETYLRPEVRAKNSIASKRAWADPEYRARMVSYTNTHKVCKVHGLVPIADCYRRKNDCGGLKLECKACCGDRKLRYRSRLETT